MEVHDKGLLTAKEAAAYLSISLTTLNKLRRERKICYVDFIGDARYRKEDLDDFARKHVSWGWAAVGVAS